MVVLGNIEEERCFALSTAMKDLSRSNHLVNFGKTRLPHMKTRPKRPRNCSSPKIAVIGSKISPYRQSVPSHIFPFTLLLIFSCHAKVNRKDKDTLATFKHQQLDRTFRHNNYRDTFNTRSTRSHRQPPHSQHTGISNGRPFHPHQKVCLGNKIQATA